MRADVSNATGLEVEINDTPHRNHKYALSSRFDGSRPAQECCTATPAVDVSSPVVLPAVSPQVTYRLDYQTLYEPQAVTTYRIEYETQYEERQVTSYRPVWETQIREEALQGCPPGDGDRRPRGAAGRVASGLRDGIPGRQL